MRQQHDEFDLDHGRLRELLADHLNGELSPESLIELDGLLAQSAAARGIYWEEVTIHAGLAWNLQGRSAGLEGVVGAAPDTAAAAGGVSTRSQRQERLLGPRFFRRSLPLVASLLAVLATCAVVWRAGFKYGRVAEHEVNANSARSMVGTLSPLAADSHWSFGKPGDTNTMDFFSGETMWLDQGVVELRLTNNTVATLEAPAILQMMSLERARVLKGRFRVTVAKGNEGFAVETPSAEVIDLGTEFSVNVGEAATDVVVFQGQVDINVTSNRESTAVAGSSSSQRMRMGQGIRVGVDGTLSRVTQVHQSDFTAGAERSPLVSAVHDNLARGETWAYYEIVAGGMREDAKAFVDRAHEWNGVDGKGLPPYLVGGDYVKTFNEDKGIDALEITLELASPAVVYVLLDQRVPPPPWLVDGFEDMGDVVGVDEMSENPADYPKASIHGPGVGPGESIDKVHSVWRRIVPAKGEVKLGGNALLLHAPKASATVASTSMYGIVVAPLEQNAAQ
jgi:hypothetical protein